MKLNRRTKLLAALCTLAFTASCKATDPAHTLTVAVDASVASVIGPLLKTAGAVKDYHVVVLTGPAKSLHRRVVQDGFSPDVLITSDLTDMMATVFPDFVAEPVPFAQTGTTQVVALRLKESLKSEAFNSMLDYLQGPEAAAKLKDAGFTPVANPRRVDPSKVEYGKDGEVKIPVVPGSQIGQSHGSKY